jgi:hypothetical protein
MNQMPTATRSSFRCGPYCTSLQYFLVVSIVGLAIRLQCWCALTAWGRGRYFHVIYQARVALDLHSDGVMEAANSAGPCIRNPWSEPPQLHCS